MKNLEQNETELNLKDMMNEDMDMNGLPNDAMEEMAEMLKAIEQEIGKEEMNRRLEETMEKLAEMNPHGIEAKLMRYQKGELKDLLLPKQYADFSSAGTITELLHNFYQNQGEDTFGSLMIEISWCMMNNGAVLVPVIVRDGRLDMPLMSDEEENDWVPLFTSAEIAKEWPEEADMQPITMEMAVLLASVNASFKGIVLNPGTAEPLPLDRSILQHLVQACNETRREEELKAKGQQDGKPVLN